MGAILTQRVGGPVAWSGHEVEADPAWIYAVDPDDIAGIEATLDADRSAFPPALAARVAAVTTELAEGRGMFLVRGLPVERWGEERTARALWLLGTALGRAIPQNARGELI